MSAIVLVSRLASVAGLRRVAVATVARPWEIGVNSTFPTLWRAWLLSRGTDAIRQSGRATKTGPNIVFGLNAPNLALLLVVTPFMGSRTRL